MWLRSIRSFAVALLPILAAACSGSGTSPTPAPLNLAGTWAVTFSMATPRPGTLSITQSGSTLTVTNPNLLTEASTAFAPWTVVVNSNTGTGTVSGSSVAITRAHSLTASNGKNSVTLTVNTTYSLTATSTSMTGSYNFSQTCSASSADLCAADGPFAVPPASGTATFTKQ